MKKQDLKKLFLKAMLLTGPLPASAVTQPRQVSHVEQLCFDAWRKALAPVSTLTNLTLVKDPVLAAVLNFDTRQCSEMSGRASVVKIISAWTKTRRESAVATRTPQTPLKIALLLPEKDSPRANAADHIALGVQSTIGEAKWITRYIPTRASAKNIEETVADLALNEHPDVIVSVLQNLAPSAVWLQLQTLNIALIDVSPRADAPADVLKMFPQKTDLAQALATKALKENLRRVAILRPAEGQSDSFILAFIAALKAAGGEVTEQFAYRKNSFETMDAASRRLFKVDDPARRGELAEAYYRARDSAKKADQPFNSRMVVLPAKIEFDAVLLPDDFRTVRYFAKLFQFYSGRNAVGKSLAGKFRMLGGTEWRSPALLNPPEPMLDQAVFVDFSGLYSSLPSALTGLASNDPGQHRPMALDPYFAEPSAASSLDYRGIGYKVGKAVLEAKTQTSNRMGLLKKLVAFTEKAKRGPYYAFTVRSGNRVLGREGILDQSLNIEEIPVTNPASLPASASSSRAPVLSKNLVK